MVGGVVVAAHPFYLLRAPQPVQGRAKNSSRFLALRVSALVAGRALAALRGGFAARFGARAAGCGGAARRGLVARTAGEGGAFGAGHQSPPWGP